MNNVTTFEELGRAKNMFMYTLGDKSTMYMKLMKKWFKLELSKMEFDIELRKILSTDQFRKHNRLMARLFSICSDLQFGTSSHRSPSSQSSKRKRQHSSSFQYAPILDYICDKRTSIPDKIIENKPTEEVRYFYNEGCIFDESLLFGRFTHAAWEYNLNGVYMDCAKMLHIAVQNFLKNVITAILSHKTGFKVKGKSFIYEMGLPVPNPWLRYPTVETEDDICTSLISAKMKANLIGSGLAFGFEQETEFSTNQHVEENLLCRLSKQHYRPKHPRQKKTVSVPEVLSGFHLNRQSILSNTMYLSCMERLIAAFYHPGDDGF